MREILFRAKHIHALSKNKHLDGKWIEGYLCDKSRINSPELEGELIIDPETVCQYTGLTDKNGRKIFEGDIVRYIDEVIGKEKVDEVKYNETHAAFCRLHKGKMGLQYLWLDETVANKCEVIGNVFDNPDLLHESRRRREMSEQEKVWILIDYIINKIHSCPLDDESGVDFEKECVGFGEIGCGECILRHLDKLDC